MATETPDPEHQALLAAIGRALGQEGPYLEVLGARGDSISLGTLMSPPAADSLRVLGGAADAASGRVAWIEERSREPDGSGFVDVRIDVRVAWDGLQRSAREVPTYNPYFGCRVGFMRWYGEALVFIYREKHRMIAARMEPPYEQFVLWELKDGCAIDGDSVYFPSDRPGLIEGRVMPSLARALPLPAASDSRDLEIRVDSPGVLAVVERPERGDDEDVEDYRPRLAAARATPRKLPLPSPPARALAGTPEHLWTRLAELLAPTAPPRHGVDLIVGAVVTPFWRDEVTPAQSYEELHKQSGHHPGYLPVYWYRYLVAQQRKKEAEQWLAWLDRLAAFQPPVLEPWTGGVAGGELAVRAALAHVQLRAPGLAEICRTGTLPEGTGCHLFTWPQYSAPLLGDAFPAGFRERMRELLASKQEG
jgi:hypothetical protein